MKVGRSGFYHYCRSLEKSHDPEEILLQKRIKAIFKEHRGQPHTPATATGRAPDWPVVRRIMREFGLEAKAPKRYKVTTDSWHTYPIAPNLLDRKFDVEQPNRFWTMDITYIWTLEVWLYLDKRMKRQFTMNALSMAYWRRKPSPGCCIIQTGAVSACHDYRKLLMQYGSMVWWQV